MTGRLAVLPGDVLAVRTPGNWVGAVIRDFAAIAGKPNLSNHIAIAHHYDVHHTLWVIEGRPGGVGWRVAWDYLRDPHTLTNAAQPKTPAQRAGICRGAQAMVGTDYDWEAIAADAAQDLHFNWAPTWHGTVAGHVVCSSLACYLYDKNGLARPPGNARTDQPADWDEWILTRGWGKP
jgi:hypothetical protein